MNYFLLTLFSVIIALAPSRVLAAANIYHCQVMSDAYIKNDGALDVLLDSPRIGLEFVVVKSTGEILEDIMDGLKKPKVVALGNSKNPYKVIWEQKSVGKNGAFVDYLSIDESVQGRKKPFGFFSGSLLLSGLCE